MSGVTACGRSDHDLASEKINQVTCKSCLAHQNPPAHKKLQIIYKNNSPYGIRDENGYLFFFAKVTKFPGQEERYRQEVQAQFGLADHLLASLRARISKPLGESLKAEGSTA
jgi:hypothetical protein